MTIAEKLDLVAQNQEKVFDAGKKAEYDRFWDEFQDNGNRTQYTYAFGYYGWTDETYNPKYPIKPTACNNMFAYNPNLTDTKVDIDLTGNGTQKYGIFLSATALKTIHKLIVKETNVFSPSNSSSMFQGCNCLENIAFEGTIGKNIDFSMCPLTPESMKNVIEHLANYQGTENENKYIVKFSDSCWEALNGSQYRPPLDQTGDWKEYVAGLGWKTKEDSQ